MKVRVDSWAWMNKAELGTSALQALKRKLTIEPKFSGDKDDEDDKGPLLLYTETDDEIGVARDYFLQNRRTTHEVDWDLTEGDKSTWPGELLWNPEKKLRAEQEAALATVKTAFRSGQYGGMVKAPPGWGKSLTASSTYVDLATGHRRSIAEGVEACPLLASLTASGAVEPRIASKIWKCGYKACVKLVLASGQWLEASLDHPVLTPAGYREMRDLRVGDLVAVARRHPRPLRGPEISDATVLLVAALTADGACSEGAAQYIKGRRDLVDRVIAAAKEQDGFEGVGADVYDRGAHYVTLKGLRPFVRRWGLDCRSREKRVPAAFFGLPDAQLALFLRWVFTDGNVYTGSPRKIEIALASEGLVDDLQYLLRRFGVCARKSYQPKRATRHGGLYDAWRLQIADAPSQLQFLDSVGDVPGLEANCAELRARALTVTPNTNWDVAPIDSSNIDQLLRDFPQLRYEGLKGRVSGETSMGRARFLALAAEYGYHGPVLALAKADVVWERVVSVTDIGMHDVYDLTVPESENAVVNGLVVHNTVYSCALIAAMQLPTLIIVHKEFLMGQWLERINEYLPNAKVGVAQQKRCEFEGNHIVVGMVHSIAKGNFPKAFYQWPGLILVDECHRIGARTWSPVPSLFKAKYRLGVSATPRRKDGAEDVFNYHLGRVLFTGREQRLKPIIKRVYTKFKLVRTPRFNPALAPESLILNFLCSNEPRNQKIVDLMVDAVKAGRKLLILSKRINHLNRLEDLFKREWKARNLGPAVSTGYYIGGMTDEARYKSSLARVIFATAQFASEGLDIPALDTLFLVTPMSDVEQAVGRIQRPYEGKKEPIVVDIRDDLISLFEAYANSRERLYARIA